MKNQFIELVKSFGGFNNYIMIATARPSDIEHAILTFKIR